MCGAPFSAPENTTPTAMPSGRLCMVTARASIAVFDRCERMPSGLSVPICRCGVSSSISSRKPMPNRNPTAAGITDHASLSASISIAGMSNDHTDAATITPDAKPNNVFCNRADISSFMNKTKAEPSIVPNSGTRSPMIIVIVISVMFFYLFVMVQRYCLVVSWAIPKSDGLAKMFSIYVLSSPSRATFSWPPILPHSPSRNGCCL